MPDATDRKLEAMPPLHPAIVHFPVALAVTSVASDTAGALLAIRSLKSVGEWTIAIAVGGAALAVAAGYRDMRRDALKARTHAMVHLHLRFGWAVLIALIALAVWRWIATLPSAIYLGLGWLTVALVLLQAWLGGELVYAHGAGVAAAGQGHLAASEAQLPSIRLYRRLMGTDPAGHGEHESD